MTKRSIAPQRGFFPQPAYVVGAFREDGEPNFTLITWITFCSVEPPTVMFASRPSKMTPSLVLARGSFSANLVTAPLIMVADYFGHTTGRERRKCADTGVSWSRGAVLDVPVLDSSPWVFECALVDTVRLDGAQVFFGRVENILVDEGVSDPAFGKVDVPALDPVIYAPLHYYRLGPRLASRGDSKGVYPLR